MDYKEMYLIMFRAARDAIDNHGKANQILIEAMQKCEEIYMNTENDSEAQ